MEVQILMSTCNHPTLLDMDLKKRKITGKCIVVNQFANKKSEDFNGNAKLYSYDEKGLSKSRNRLISNADADISMITDDDITFADDYEKLITKAYEDHPEADIITFNILIGDKIKGSSNILKHNFFSLMSVASCQISFKTSKIKENKIMFNEQFGIGAPFKSGEENIFLNECRKKGLRLIHIPTVICSHPEELTTGELWDQKLVESKGALSYELLGWKHFAFLLYFMILKRKYYYKNMKMITFFKFYMQGIKKYKKTR